MALVRIFIKQFFEIYINIMIVETLNCIYFNPRLTVIQSIIFLGSVRVSLKSMVSF